MADELTNMLTKIAVSFIAYAGPLDDPSVGWVGHLPSHNDLFKCERCGKENMDSTKIEHSDGCSAKALLDALEDLRKFMK